jgi:hypothetical protein
MGKLKGWGVGKEREEKESWEEGVLKKAPSEKTAPSQFYFVSTYKVL